MITTAAKCDAACPATAGVTVRLPGDRELDFCMHHYTRYQEPLEAAGATVVIQDAELPREAVPA